MKTGIARRTAPPARQGDPHPWKPPPISGERARTRRRAHRSPALCLCLALLGHASLARAFAESEQGARHTDVELIDHGLDRETGVYRVDLRNAHKRPLTAAGVEVFVAAADGTSHLRGLSHDVLQDEWVSRGQVLSFEIDIGEVREPDLWAFDPRIAYALFEDRSWTGDEIRVEKALRARAAALRESRRLLARLEASTVNDLRRVLVSEARRGERAGKRLDLSSHPSGPDAEPHPDRAAYMAAARSHGRQAASWAEEIKTRGDDALSRAIYLRALSQSIERLAAGTRPEDARRLEKVAVEEER
jgi:hypothetical protein